MALTTSEIIARNKENDKDIQELVEAMNKYDEEHAEEFAAAKAKTEAVLNGTSDKLVKNKEKTGTEIVEQSREYLENLNKETGANVQQDLGQYWANYGAGPGGTQVQTLMQQLAGSTDVSNEPSLVSPIFSFAGGFAIGAALIAIYFKFKIKRVKEDCDTRVAESRDTLDRMISVMSKDK